MVNRSHLPGEAGPEPAPSETPKLEFDSVFGSRVKRPEYRKPLFWSLFAVLLWIVAITIIAVMVAHAVATPQVVCIGILLCGVAAYATVQK